MGKGILTETDRRAGVSLHAEKKHAPDAPPEEQKALIKLGDATRMLAEVRDAPSAKKLMDVAAAAEVYARKAKLGADAITYASGIKLDAERKLGQYLAATEKDRGGGDTRSTGTRQAPVESPPTLAEMGISKKLSSEAQRLAKLPDEVFEKVKAGEMKPTAALRNQHRTELVMKAAALPEGKFRVIYADPPWSYGDERGGLEKEGTAAAAQYPTMSTEAICDLEVDGRHISDLGADDAVLFMWATFPLLEDALQVVDEWKFKYKTAFVWDKERSNIGNYHDARAELLIIATRGSCPIEIDTRPKQVQTIARGRHSAKPEAFRELIDLMYPTGPRIELFRRGGVPGNWKTWGNEATTEAA